MVTVEISELRPGWIYEVIAVTRGAGGPHAAPIGIVAPGGGVLKAELFKGSATLANIEANGVLGVCVTCDAGMLHAALQHRERLRFAAWGEAWFIEGAQAWIEAGRVRLTEGGKVMRLEAEVVRYRAFGPVRPLNRADGLLLESLILSTRRFVLPPERVREQLLENLRVIAKVAPGSAAEVSMRELLADIGLDVPAQSSSR